MQRKRGSESFWGKFLKGIRVTDNAHFKKKECWIAYHGRITVVYIDKRNILK